MHFPMNSNERYVYEVTYDVVDQHRNEYEMWLSKTTEQWIAIPKLSGFRSEQSVMEEDSEVRLRLEFETRADWATFVESEPYQQRIKQLQTMIESLTTHLWEPTAISLDPTTDGGVPIATCNPLMDND